MADASKLNDKKSHRRFSVMTLILWLLVLVLAGGLAYMFWQNNELSKPEAQTRLAEQASQNVVDSVAKLIIVPEDKPTVATITDVNKLREANESFYKNAKNGDMLLLYTTMAIIYRSADNKIVNVAPVVVDPSASSTTNETSGVENITADTDTTTENTTEENTTNETDTNTTP